jgi:signal transduction histidine kinase
MQKDDHGPGAMRRPIPRVFRDDETGDSVERERMLWIGGCVVGLLFLSLVSGAWLLVRSERKAREDAMRKTDFLSNVSHEFKTPLTTICLCAELAQDEGMDPARRKKALQSILSEANRLKALVLQALDFSRLEKKARRFNLAKCDLGEIARESSAALAERFAADGLAVDGCGAACAVADTDAVRQIVAVLLDNAAKYAAKGGAVELSSGVEGGKAFISVADRGPGLASDALRHAFDRFWRGDNATTAETGGSGLGLAIARELARGMGGDLTVARRAGGGLVFTLALPAANEGEQ